MNANTPTPQAPSSSCRGWPARASAALTALTPSSAIALLQRLGIAGVFWLSGRTKVDAQGHITESTYALFRDEYHLPLLPPELAAPLAAGAEHLFPLLLVLGLGTRMSALALLGMTVVIQTFVYPDAWATHLSWAAVLVPLVGRGGGAWSMDAMLTRWWNAQHCDGNRV